MDFRRLLFGTNYLTPEELKESLEQIRALDPNAPKKPSDVRYSINVDYYLALEEEYQNWAALRERQRAHGHSFSKMILQCKVQPCTPDGVRG